LETPFKTEKIKCPKKYFEVFSTLKGENKLKKLKTRFKFLFCANECQPDTIKIKSRTIFRVVLTHI
jgi:hypothetical protein